MSDTTSTGPDHGVIEGAPSVPPPVGEVAGAPRLSPAEEARTLLARTNVAALASMSDGGEPWASLITYGALEDGSPVLCLSQMAEHGRNVARDPRASVMITAPELPADPLAVGRVTLAGRCLRPADARETATARAAHLAAVPAASVYVDFSDFALWILRVERVRWVGGYGRMDSASAEAFAAARADPVAGAAAGAIAHLNADHADALLTIARALGGYPDASAALCTGLDRYGIDLSLDTARGRAPTRVAWSAPLSQASALRSASVELTRRAQSLLGVEGR
jgi:heme iron utilization protein